MPAIAAGLSLQPRRRERAIKAPMRALWSPIWSAAAAAAAFVCHRHRSNIQKRQLRLPHSKTSPCLRVTGKIVASERRYRLANRWVPTVPLIP